MVFAIQSADNRGVEGQISRFEVIKSQKSSHSFEGKRTTQQVRVWIVASFPHITPVGITTDLSCNIFMIQSSCVQKQPLNLRTCKAPLRP